MLTTAKIYLTAFLANFRRDEKGASMVEYAVALIVIAAIGVTLMNSLGTAAKAKVQPPVPC
jgi:Flp pilus assembly pilin Flp